MYIFKAADILLPKVQDFSKWSVVACDQFSSEPEKWESAAEYAAGAPSALNIIFPEAYLNDGHDSERIEKINQTMNEYIESGLFKEYPESLIYVERTQSDGRVRRGVVGAIDLECYDYSKGSQSPVRATEGTIMSRIPPRKRIRENAPLELPHILMLIDDRERRVIEPLSDRIDKMEQLYDFDLMLGGGHIRGWLLDDSSKKEVLDGVLSFSDEKRFEEKYGVSGKGVLAIAVGDGNHSLATAKACWEELKKNLTEEERKTHPARFALAELVNLHDDALEFEPIQRVLFDVDPDAVETAFEQYYPQMTDTDNGGQRVTIVRGEKERTVYIDNAPSNLAVGTLQKFLDEYIEKNGGTIDYIHGNDVVRSLTSASGTIGFTVGAMEKNDLFETVIKDGALPRKTFSMGEACDKRYYLEAKKIK